MTLTEERPADPAPPPEQPQRRGVGLLWFAGSALFMLHLVVLVGLGILAVRSDSSDAESAAGDAAPGVESVFIATEFAFDPENGREETGDLTITLDNEGAIFHNLLIEGVPGFVVEADGGATGSAAVQLDDGVYVIYCSVPGHREAGMEGTLTIG